jgi:AcrR family transcriptional regulator
MTIRGQSPTGVSSRRHRLSDEETQRRMLDAALGMVHRTGLTVSLDHLSFEDVIRDARVSRSAVYRRWPYKDLFFSDLLLELARAATPAAISNAAASAPEIQRVAVEHLDWLDTEAGRDQLALELMRQGALHDFEMMYGSTEWRTYLALHATFLSVADDDLRRDLQVALAESEADFISRLADSWRRLCGLFGFRLRPELDATFESFASLISATLRGQVLMALSTPDIATQRMQARPFGAAEAAEWSQPAMALTSLALAYLETDPAVEWTAERLAGVRDAFATLVAAGG